jgi:hypothetical protein
MTPTERALRARVAAHRSWQNTSDPAARTAPARAAMLERFAREVDPDGTLPAAERARRAESARNAYMTGLALKSAVARRQARAATVSARVAESDLRAAA